MTTPTRRPALLAAALLVGTLLGVNSPALAAEREAGEGVLCIWGIAATIAEVGKYCPVSDDPAFQAALEESVAVMDRYVAVNGGLDDAGITAFKRKHAKMGADPAKLCRPALMRMWENFRAQGAAALQQEVAKAVERPGTPTFGDCL